jgi:hypothetical protein
MSGGDLKGRRQLIDGAVKARFVSALREGCGPAGAAASVGFLLESLYSARRRDALFRYAWDWAVDLHSWYERAAAIPATVDDGAEVRIAPQRNRPLQRRRMRWVKFNESRQRVFLDHFAATADARAAAAAAGIESATVNVHKRRNPEFAAAWQEALDHAVAVLEAESVRQRLDAQRRLSEELNPTGEAAEEFERVMKLLQRWDRRRSGADSPGRRPAEGKAWTFEEAIAALDARLRALGLRRTVSPANDDAPAQEAA